MDRSLSFGAEGGPLFMEIQSALRSADCEPRPKIVSRVFGLGGRAIMEGEIREMFDELDSDRPGKFRLVGVRDSVDPNSARGGFVIRRLAAAARTGVQIRREQFWIY